MTDITPEAMREMAEKLDDMSSAWANGGCIDDAEDSANAAAMLRSIAAERDAETKVQTEMRDDILRLKSAMVKNGWIEA